MKQRKPGSGPKPIIPGEEREGVGMSLSRKAKNNLDLKRGKLSRSAFVNRWLERLR